MSTLRVGGPCIHPYSGQRFICSQLPKQEGDPITLSNHLHDPTLEPGGWYDSAEPTKFIKGDVVMHSARPEYGRGMVCQYTALAVAFQNGVVLYICAEDAMPSVCNVKASALTLLFPAQEATTK